MVVDTPALLAVVLGETECDRHAGQVRRPRRGRSRRARGCCGSRLVAVDAAQAYLAREAYARFGKGRSPAALNYGDCFSYAPARAAGRPLPFNGADFAETDIVPAAA
jgi:ribonuclease VapC